MNPSELMLWTEQLTHRIASEELAGQAPPGATVEAPAAVGFAAPPAVASPAHRRSWFAGSLADVETVSSAPVPRRMSVRTGPQTTDPRASLRVELERVLENLGPEDLSLAIVLLGERLLGSALVGIAQFSPQWLATMV